MMGGALSSGSRMCVGWGLESVMGHTKSFSCYNRPGTWLLTNTSYHRTPFVIAWGYPSRHVYAADRRVLLTYLLTAWALRSPYVCAVKARASSI